MVPFCLLNNKSMKMLPGKCKGCVKVEGCGWSGRSRCQVRLYTGRGLAAWLLLHYRGCSTQENPCSMAAQCTIQHGWFPLNACVTGYMLWLRATTWPREGMCPCVSLAGERLGVRAWLLPTAWFSHHHKLEIRCHLCSKIIHFWGTHHLLVAKNTKTFL